MLLYAQRGLDLLLLQLTRLFVVFVIRNTLGGVSPNVG